MSSQFLGLSIASSGLRSANTKLNVTSNNIANVNTKGYSRQEVTSKANAALRVNESYGCVGTGVVDISIDRVTSAYYTNKYMDNHTKLGTSETLDYYNRIIEQDFNGEDGFTTLYSNMVNSLQDIMTTMDSNASKQQFISSGISFANYFNELNANLKNMQEDISKEIYQSVGKINTIAKEISTVNRQISVIGYLNQNANELCDKRDELIKELSYYTKISVDDKNGQYNVRLSDGSLLVSNNEYENITYDKNNEQFLSKSGNVVHLEKSGQIAGLMQMKNGDGINGSYQGIEYYKNQITSFVDSLGTKMNEVLKNGYTSDDKEGIELFSNTNLKNGKLVVNTELIDNPNKLATKGVKFDGVSNVSIIDKLNDVLINKNEFSFKNSSGQQFLETILSDITLNTNNSTSNSKLYGNIESIINNKITSISGVDSDEEALNLIKYKNAYELSAKAMQVMSEIYDKLINEIGV